MKEGIIIVAILAGAWLGDHFKLPSGILVGGMIAGLVAKGFVHANVPAGSALSIISQLLVAYVIVSNSDVGVIRKHPEIIPLALGFMVALIAFCFGAAWVLNRAFGLDLRTAIYATAPGGLSGMALSAADAGAETPISLMFHMFRITIILISTPLIASIAAK